MEACEGCDKTEQTQNTLFSNGTQQHVKGRSADSTGGDLAIMIRHIGQNNNGLYLSRKNIQIGIYNVVVVCVGVVYEEYFSYCSKHIEQRR